MKIVVTDHTFGALKYERAVAEQHACEFQDFQCTDIVDTREAIRDAYIVFNNFAPMNKEVLEALPCDTLIIRYGVGVDNVDIEAATQRNITVCNVPDYGATAVADHATAFILALARRLATFDRAMQDGRWGAKSIVPRLPDLQDLTVGLLGFGRIAQEAAKRLSAFGSTLISSDPFADRQAAGRLGVEIVDITTLFERSNVLSIHAPLVEATNHIVNQRTISAMPDGAIIVNTSRGGLVDEVALANALHEGKLSGAALDVFEQEPPVKNSPLNDVPNLLRSPHAAFYSDRSLDNLQRLAAEEAGRFIRGESLRSALNL
ncbi:C-terminal binding protein [Hoeflea prorocentri]|uniref:C-terminal binding protein n=1 Tax=Hoeflea prorocentri TaxID=1922333 RepID=A0A9X3UEC8_9HYPH|nr:C-terminal binding protein [Hoeflea prorocentri]MCY6379772.1 C-terminal binding protein [Hoeflea prorocentri]MDA5397572.1 C-terminal binding protein [Hoeflea prorocentri]